MKKSILLSIIVSALSFQTTYSHLYMQDEKKCIHFISASGGMNFSKAEFLNFDLDLDNLLSYQFQVSYEIRRNYDNNFDYGLKIGLGFINRDFDIGTFIREDSEGNIIELFDSHTSKDYVYVPINGCVYYKFFFIKGGIYLAHQLDQKLVQVGENENIFDDEIKDSFDWGLDVGAGIEWELTDNIRFNLIYTYHSISKTFNNNWSHHSHLIDLGLSMEI